MAVVEPRDAEAPSRMETGETARGPPETSSAGSRSVGNLGVTNQRMPRVVSWRILLWHKGTLRCGHVNEAYPPQVLHMAPLPTSGAGGRAGLQGVAGVTVKRFLEGDCWMVSSIGHLPPVFLGAPAAVSGCPMMRHRATRQTLGL